MERRGRYTPGPGKYEMRSTFARAASKGKPVGGLAPLRTFSYESMPPGPGAYENPTKIGDAPKYSLGATRFLFSF